MDNETLGELMNGTYVLDGFPDESGRGTDFELAIDSSPV
jgi:hypothetical protein